MTDTNRASLACFEDAISLAANEDNTGLDAELRTACDRFAVLLSAGSALEYGVSGERIDRLFAAIRACRGEP